jgi:uncharacterized protein YjiS (DUF1127 family)
MTSVTNAMCSSASTEQANGHGPLQLAKGLWHAYWEQRAQRASIYLLRSLDDRTLSDIGMARSEIESVVHDTSGQRLRTYDPKWE